MPDDRPTLAFGELNPVEEPTIGRHLDPRNTKATDIIREAARNVFQKDTLTNSGAFKGIVLRVEKNPTNEEPNSWIANIFGNERRPALLTLKIRIPEIHASLPEPSKYGSQTGEHHKVIDMYPTFIPATQEVSNQPPAPGDIVFCDFANRENLTHPVYLGPVFAGPSPGAVGKSSAQKIFENENKGRFCADGPSGDSLFGVKNIINQIPIALALCSNNPKQLNNAGNRDNINRAAEQAHDRGRLQNGMPTMRRFEDKWKRGQNLGPIELVEILSPFANRSNVWIAKDQAETFFAMREAAKRDDINIILRSGFRSFDQQKFLYDKFQRGTGDLAARPGYSNHQSGIAFDIDGCRGGTTPTYIWLSKNAHRFGFINSGRFFKKQREAWHWIYLSPNNERVIAEGKLSVKEKQKVFLV